MPIPVRGDYDAEMVRAAAKRSKDGPQARRLLALAAVYDGATRTEAAKIGGVTLQIVRDWVMKFNADGPEGLIDRKPPGQAPRLNGAHHAALAAIIESGPIPAVHGVVRWQIIALRPIAELYAVTGIPLTANRSPRRNTAQAIRASLLAKATTATLRWARLMSPLAHRPSGVSRSAT